jgi:hypothetical protein
VAQAPEPTDPKSSHACQDNIGEMRNTQEKKVRSKSYPKNRSATEFLKRKIYSNYHQIQNICVNDKILLGQLLHVSVF